MIKIRKAKTSDPSQLETLFLITRDHTFHWDSPDKFKLEDFKQSTSGETMFAAEDEGSAIVGFVSVWEQDAIHFIHNLFLAQNHRILRRNACSYISCLPYSSWRIALLPWHIALLP
jgi:hypothetical protein